MVRYLDELHLLFNIKRALASKPLSCTDEEVGSSHRW